MMKAVLTVALAALVSMSACSAEDEPPESAADVVVQISSNQFTPASVTIKVGQTVRWTWAGGSHNVVSGPDCSTQDGKFYSGPPQSGGTFDKKFEQAGTYPYYCEPHCTMGMTGQVIVEP